MFFGGPEAAARSGSGAHWLEAPLPSPGDTNTTTTEGCRHPATPSLAQPPTGQTPHGGALDGWMEPSGTRRCILGIIFKAPTSLIFGPGSGSINCTKAGGVAWEEIVKLLLRS